MAKIKVYGADWCSMTLATLAHLEKRGVEFDYVDVDKDPAGSAWVKEQNGGKEKKPTLDMGGEILSEPTNAEVDAAIERMG